MKRGRKWWMVIATALLLIGLAGCGGGGSTSEGGGSSGGTPQSYNGAAAVGDFAKFSFDAQTKRLEYNISGPVFGDQSGAETLTQILGNFYTDDAENIFFFSGSLGVGIVDVDGVVTFVSGLQMQESIDTDRIINKRYVLALFEPDGNGDFNAKLEFADINGTPGSNHGDWWGDDFGTWRTRPEGDRLEILDSADETIGYAIIRAGASRAGFILDLKHGGFGIGLEVKPLEAPGGDVTYTYLDHSFADKTNCYGEVTLSPAADGNVTFSWADKYCEDSNGTLRKVTPGSQDSNGTGRLILNPTVTMNNGQSEQLVGIACVAAENAPDTCNGGEFAMFDPDDGYYISVNLPDSNCDPAVQDCEPMISIGSNK